MKMSKEMESRASDTLLDGTPKPIIMEKAVLMEEDDDPEEGQCDCEEYRYGFGDAVFSCFVVAPLVVGVWRGVWGVMDLNRDLFPIAQSFVLGMLVHVCFALIRSQLLARSGGAWRADGAAGRWLRERVLSRVYSCVFILANITHWRGGWGLLDATVAAIAPNEKDPHRPVAYAAFTIACYLSAVFLRSSRNILASPYFLVTDGKEATYIFTTRFKKNLSSRETALYVLDCVFSVCVVGSLVVFVWRGSWALLDIFLYPGHQLKSCWCSLIVGYALVIATFSLQAPARWVAARLRGAPRLLLADAYHLLSFVATVNVWRGVWGLLDIYFFPDTPKLSNWCSHTISLGLLILLNCSNSVLVRGVYIDAEEPAGECVVFPCHYLRLFIHKERTKKRHKRTLAAAATATARRSEDASLPLQIAEEKVYVVKSEV